MQPAESFYNHHTAANAGAQADAARRHVTALWAANEAMVGGVLYALKLPLKSLVLGGFSAVCQCLLGYYRTRHGWLSGQHLAATSVVLGIKAGVAPHSSLGGYVAVALQGLLGELLFISRKTYALSCCLMGMLAVSLSALQRLVVFTVVFGADLWRVFDDFLHYVQKQIGFQVIDGYGLIALYLAVHLLLGLGIGIWAAGLPKRLADYRTRYAHLMMPPAATAPPAATGSKRGIRLGWAGWILAGLALLLLAQTYLQQPWSFVPGQTLAGIVLRGACILLLWYAVVGPTVREWLTAWLLRRKDVQSLFVREVLATLPQTRSIVAACWQQASAQQGVARLRLFVRLLTLNLLAVPLAPTPAPPARPSSNN
jgi:hypothetical protein